MTVARLMPQTLRGQLLSVLLLAVLGAQTAGTFLLLDERRLAVRAALGAEVVGRAANVTRLLEESPPAMHSTILGAADSPLVRFRVDPEPLAQDIQGMGAEDVARRLSALLANAEPRAIAVQTRALSNDTMMPPFSSVGGSPHIHPDPGNAMVARHMPEMHRRMMAFHRSGRGALELTLSIRLADSAWLNVATQLRPPALQLTWSAAISTALLLATIAGVVWFSVRRLTQPMEAIAEQAERLGRGDDVTPIPLSGPIELRRTIDAFNRMQARLRRFIRERTEIVAALAHDLRSPLTAMRFRAEMLDPSEDRQRLELLITEMEQMTEASLTFGRGVTVNEPMTEIDLSNLVEQIAAELRETAAAVEFTSAGAVTVSGRPIALKRALRNLVENAIRYGERATISVSRQIGEAVLIVSDEGPGLDEEALERAFEPYLRFETSRSRETGGAGLGLAIARDVVRSHGGEIVLRNRPSRGLDAVVTLPLTKARETGPQ